MSRPDHNRYLGFEHIRAQSEYEREKETPTAKQKKFFKSLVMKCKANDVDCNTGLTRTRGQYAHAIDTLLARLQEAGVDVKGNGKTATLELHHKSDARNNDFMTTERIRIDDEPKLLW